MVIDERPVAHITHEELAAIAKYEAKLEKAIDRHIAKAIEAAIERFGIHYADEYLYGQLRDKYRAFAPPPATPPSYRKKKMSHTLQKRVWERDAYRCQDCGTWEDLTVDHIIPESKGGPTKLDNLQTLCRPCNSKKGTS